MDAAQFLRVEAVQLDEDLVSHAADGRQDAHALSGNDLAVFRHVDGLNDSHVYAAEEAVTQRLRQLREVHVEILRAVSVEQRAHVLVRLVGGTEFYSLGACQCTVQVVAGRGAGEHSDFEGSALLVFLFCPSRDGFGDDLRTARRRKSAKSDVVVVFHISGGFFRRDEFQ